MTEETLKFIHCPLPGCGDRLFNCPKECMECDCDSTKPVDIKQYLNKNPFCLCERGKRCATGWLISINKDAPEGSFRTCTDPTGQTMLKWVKEHYPHAKDFSFLCVDPFKEEAKQ